MEKTTALDTQDEDRVPGGLFVQAALALAERGFRVLPVRERGKAPLVDDWPNRASCDSATIRMWSRGYGADCNVGIATGSTATGDPFIVLDVDGEAGEATIRALESQLGVLPPTLTARTGGGGFHIFYGVSEPIGNSAGTLGPKVDVRGNGGQVVAAGSVHASGEWYAWIDDAPMVDLPAAWLARLKAPSTRAAQPFSLEPGELIGEGQRDTTLFKLACSLRARGLSQDAIRAALDVENAQRCRPPLETAEIDRIAGSAARYAPGDAWNAELRSRAAQAVTASPGPIAEPLPDFPTEHLPASMRALVESESARLRLPAGMLALAALVTAAAAVGGQRTVYTDDREHPTSMWGAIVAGSGAGKSPAIDVAMRPLRDLAALRRVERRRALDELRKWERDRSADKGEPPYVPPPLTITDVTTEALAEALQGAPRGICLDVDELGGWAGQLDAYRPGGRGPDRLRYAQMWSGHGHEIVRKGQAPVVVDDPRIYMVGGIQPAVLPALNSVSDGLAQRFLYSVHTEYQEGYPSRELPDSSVLSGWQVTIQSLVSSDPGQRCYRMTTDGLTAWMDGRDQRVDAQRAHGSPELYGKLDSIAARLALVLTLAGNCAAKAVDADAVHAAWSLCLDYFAPHGRAALAGTGSVSVEHPLIPWLRVRGGSASLRDVYTYKVGGADDKAKAAAIVDGLAARGLIVTKVQAPPTGGRPITWVALP